MNRYSQAAKRVRQDLPTVPDLRDLIRFATLAANSHNTQPWKFRIAEDAIDILPDFTRRTPTVDPDDHHLYVTLGCAAENLLIAANVSGRAAKATIQKDEADNTFVRITLGNGPKTNRALCDAIPKRQSTKSEYDGTSLSEVELRALESSVVCQGVKAHFITDRTKMEQALEFIQAGNSAQMDDPEFVKELKSWIRFSTDTSIKAGDGLSGPPAGNPSSPDWLGSFLFRLVFRKKKENEKLAKQLRSSAGLVVFVADNETQEGWINVGRCFEKFALTATVMGLCHAHVNMPVEDPTVRPDFAKWLGIEGRRPDLVIRIGRAEPMPMSLRRPVDDVIIT